MAALYGLAPSGISIMSAAGPASVTLVHFNDVYEIKSGKKEPVGGAPRFATKLKEIAAAGGEKPIVVFSGDGLSPSILSLMTRGEHMIDVFNEIGVDVATPGNHDFDFGVDALIGAINRSKFPWILANLKTGDTDCPTLNGKLPHHIIERGGLTLGFIGLMEREWIATLHTNSEDELEYTDFAVVGEQLASQLKRDHGCDAVIAVTHMRLPNDRLAARIPGVDLVLGGHDHHYVYEPAVEGVSAPLVKSGTNFRDLSSVQLAVGAGGAVEVEVTRHSITSAVPEDKGIAAVVQKWSGEMEKLLGNRLGGTAVDLDCRFCRVRSQETNSGNFLADAVREGCDADLAIIGAGTLRADTVIPVGDVLHRDIVSLLPYADGLVVLALTGEQVIAALENGVSQYPKLDGRFPCVSGLRFSFDPSASPGERVDRSSVLVHGEPIRANAEYTTAVTLFHAGGHDGYDVLRGARVVRDVECTPVIPTLIHNEFKTLEYLKLWREGGVSSVRVPKRSKSVLKYGGGPVPPGPDAVHHARIAADTWLARTRSQDKTNVDHARLSHLAPPSLPVEVGGKYAIHPVEDGRITIRVGATPASLNTV